jgi:hypothetical protein
MVVTKNNKTCIRIFSILLILICVSCGKLYELRKYEGQPVEVLEKNLGKPTTIIPTSEGQLYVYNQTEELQGMEISKGQGTLDPMLTPAALKKEKLLFKVIKGVVVEVTREVEYERK